MRALLLLLLLSGCYNWREEAHVGTVQITWVRTNDILNGYAQWNADRTQCTIWASPHSESLIGHEVKHCFGWVHDD